MTDVRRPPRPVDKRNEPDDTVVVRCRLCDWELINGEGLTRTRPCCPAGLQFDLDHGLTLTGGTWRKPKRCAAIMGALTCQKPAVHDGPHLFEEEFL